MINNNTNKLSNLNSFLENYCTKRSKQHKTNDPFYDQYRQNFYTISEILEHDFNADAFSLTVTFPPRSSLIEEWEHIEEFIINFKKFASKQFMLLGGLIAVEAHKNSTLKSKKGKNTKAGRPKLEMLLWFGNQFLNPHMHKLRFMLELGGTMVTIKQLKKPADVLKTALYVTKDRDNTDLRIIVQNFLGWNSNVNVWVNQKEVEKCFCMIATTIDPVFCSKELYMKFPTTRKHKDKGLVLVELCYKLFTGLGLAVRDNYVYRKIEKSRFSWKRKQLLEDWFSGMFILTAPMEYLEMLKQNCTWIVQQGKTSKSALKFELFPKLKIQPFLVEFKDAIYDLKTGQLLDLREVAPETATLCYIDKKVNFCTPPYNTIGLLWTLINSGREESKKIERLFEIPIKDLKKDERLFLETTNKSFNRFFRALQVFGGFYHPQVNRKKNPALFLTGNPSTCKTLIISTIFEQVIGLENVDILSRHKNRFNFGVLRKNDDSPYVLLLDDFRWQDAGMYTGDFLNLLDGNFVPTENKFEKRASSSLKGTIAITSNEKFETEAIPHRDMNALKTRIKEVKVHTLTENLSEVDSQLVERLKDEAVGFSILSNAVFMAKNWPNGKKAYLPSSFYQNNQQQIDDERGTYKSAGVLYIKQVLDFIESQTFLPESLCPIQAAQRENA